MEGSKSRRTHWKTFGRVEVKSGKFKSKFRGEMVRMVSRGTTCTLEIYLMPLYRFKYKWSQIMLRFLNSETQKNSRFDMKAKDLAFAVLSLRYL